MHIFNSSFFKFKIETFAFTKPIRKTRTIIDYQTIVEEFIIDTVVSFVLANNANEFQRLSTT